MPLTEIIVEGDFIDAQGEPREGMVDFVPTSWMQSPLDNLIVSPVPVSVPLDAEGHFEVSLIANDDPDIQPQGVLYSVTERITGAPSRTYEIEVEAGMPGGRVNLADLGDLVQGPVDFQYLVLAGGLTADIVGAQPFGTIQGDTVAEQLVEIYNEAQGAVHAHDDKYPKLTGGSTITSDVVNKVSLILKGMAAQTAAMFAIRDSTNADLFYVLPDGRALHKSQTPGSVAFRFDAAPAQTADIVQVRDDAGTNLFRIGAPGSVYLQNGSWLNRADQVAENFLKASAPGQQALQLRQAAAQTANPFSLTDSAGNTVAYLSSGGIYVKPSATVTDLMFVGTVSGEANHRFRSQVDGKLEWGPGGATPVDTNLRRGGAGLLQTDNGFQALTLGIGAARLGGWQASISPQLAGTGALALRAMAAHTADMFQVQDSAGVSKARITPAGTVSLAGNLDATGNLQSGSSVLAVYFQHTTQTGTYLQPSASTLMAYSRATADAVMAVRGMAAQAGDIFQAQDSAGSAVFRIDNDGDAYAKGVLLGAGGGGVSLTGGSEIVNSAAAQVALALKAHASQTADIFQTRNSAGTALAKITAAGTVVGVGTTPFIDNDNHEWRSAGNGGWIFRNNWNVGGGFIFQADNGAGIVQALRIGRGGELYFGTAEDVNLFRGAANVLETQDVMRATAFEGVGNNASAIAGAPLGSTNLAVYAGAAGNRPLVVRGAASQSGDLFQAQDSAGGILQRLTAGGQVQSAGASASFHTKERSAQSMTWDMYADAGYFKIYNNGDGMDKFFLGRGTGLQSAVRAAPAVTGSLMEWQSSTGATLAHVDNDGDIYSKGVLLGGGGGGAAGFALDLSMMGAAA